MKVGIIGAGTMGSGIAQAFAQVDGYEVCLCDINEEFASNGKLKITKNFEKRVAKGKMAKEDADKILARIHTGVKTICSDCDLVVEAAIENMEIKKQTFKELGAICKADCVFATNTSSLSITEIGAGLDRPVIGMHFFNPAPVMKLVEVIAGLNTPVEIVDKVKKISEEIGKIPVQVEEGAGFVVNRILIPMINEAIGIYAEGEASGEVWTLFWLSWKYFSLRLVTRSTVRSRFLERWFAAASLAVSLAKASTSTTNMYISLAS